MKTTENALTHKQINNNKKITECSKNASKATSLNRDIQNKNKNAKDLVSSMLQY